MREYINEYQKLNSEDQKVVRRWLWANAVVGAIILTGLIAERHGEAPGMYCGD